MKAAFTILRRLVFLVFLILLLTGPAIKNLSAENLAAQNLKQIKESPGQKTKPTWEGVDKSVIEKYAEDYGRKAGPSFFSIEGDPLLFAFLLAGFGAGFLCGYYWRLLFAKKNPESENQVLNHNKQNHSKTFNPKKKTP